MLNNNQQGGYLQNLFPNQQQQLQNQNQLNQQGQFQQNQNQQNLQNFQNQQNQQLRNQQQFVPQGQQQQQQFLPQGQQFGAQNNQGSPFRTAALMDDEIRSVSASGETLAAATNATGGTTEISVKGVGAAKSTTSPSRPPVAQQQQHQIGQQQQQIGAGAAARPLSLVVRRPAISFLAFGRPW